MIIGISKCTYSTVTTVATVFSYYSHSISTTWKLLAMTLSRLNLKPIPIDAISKESWHH